MVEVEKKEEGGELVLGLELVAFLPEQRHTWVPLLPPVLVLSSCVMVTVRCLCRRAALSSTL